jgi:predicted nucleic acid-binding protein
MILVDTNVWSEAFRRVPDANVERWAGANAEHLWLSPVVIGELLSGAHMLADGKRKRRFLEGYDSLIQLHLDRIAVFDLAAARAYGPILAVLEKAGRNPTTADAQLAATASSRGMKLATRNTRDFAGLDLELINPWEG